MDTAMVSEPRNEPTLFRRSDWILFLTVFLAFIAACTPFPAVASPLQEARVIAVNDGDTVTIVMNGKKQRVRLIGIDAPEMGQEPWGKRSRQHLRKILKDRGWNVLIETDIQPRDKYNRLLVYIWDSRNGMINEQMLREGFAVLFTIQPNSRYVERLRKAQRYARENKLGIWGENGLNERPLDYKKKHPRR